MTPINIHERIYYVFILFAREKVEDLSSETERLKRSLTAKDEVERTQIEAIHQLTARNKKLESEVSQFQSQLDDVTQKHETIKKSFDAAKKELADKTKATTELIAREQMLESLENEKRMTESQNEQVNIIFCNTNFVSHRVFLILFFELMYNYKILEF